jgi:hypothetical protein
MRVAIRRGSFADRIRKRFFTRKIGGKLDQVPSFISKKTKFLKGRCAKQLTRNLQNYKKQLMKTNGFYVYRSILCLQNQNAGVTANKVYGFGKQLVNQYTLPSQAFNATPTSKKVQGTIQTFGCFCFQPQWPGESTGYFQNTLSYEDKAVFGAIGNTENAINPNFKSTFSPCNKAVVFGGTAECSKVFGEKQNFNKIYIYNSTITLELQNYSNELVTFYALDIKIRERKLLSNAALKDINFDTFFTDIEAYNSAADEASEYHLSKQLERGKLPHKLFQVLKVRKYKLGPSAPAGSSGLGPTGSRNIPNRKTVTFKYNNLKTLNRSVTSSQGGFNGLDENLLEQSAQEDVYTLLYFMPSYTVSGTAADTSQEVSVVIRKSIAFGTQ